MSDILNKNLIQKLASLEQEGILKSKERVISGRVPAQNSWGPRVTLEGSNKPYIRANSNSYLDLNFHSQLIQAAEAATLKYGVGPGAVRFIDGTFPPHKALEKAIAEFAGYPAARIFNSAYAANLSLILGLHTSDTFWLCDALNHNSLIRGLKMAGVVSGQKVVYSHCDLSDLESKLQQIPKQFKRICILTDGVFSMRGDVVPLTGIQNLALRYQDQFEEGICLVVDDSHGVGALGSKGKGVIESSDSLPYALVGTFGKAFGVNGGFVAGSTALIEFLRQKGDTYIYTNPLGAAESAAALEAVNLLATSDGHQRLENLKNRTLQFREGVQQMGFETIPGPHPVVSVLTRSSTSNRELVSYLYEQGILVIGLSYPVVPKGEECIRFQINAGMTSEDIVYILDKLSEKKLH